MIQTENMQKTSRRYFNSLGLFVLVKVIDPKRQMDNVSKIEAKTSPSSPAGELQYNS